MKNHQLAADLKKARDDLRKYAGESVAHSRSVTNEHRLDLFTRRWLLEWTSGPKPVGGRASRLMHDLITFRPEEAWRRILAVIAEAKDDHALKLIGAGPLEDLLSFDAEQFIERVEAQAAADSRFRVSLSNVWGMSVIETSIYSRIQKATKNEK